MKPIHCLLLALLLMVAGCDNGSRHANDVELQAVDEVKSLDVVSDSSSTADEAIEPEPADNDISVEPTNESEPLVDDSDSLPSGESEVVADPVHTFELRLDNTRAALYEGEQDGTTIVVEVSPDGDESIELIIDPENSLDAHGIEFSVSLQRLDRQNRIATVNFKMSVGMHPQIEHKRTVMVSAISGDEIRTQTITLDIKPVNAPDVYLLIGQSNMVGSSKEGVRQLTPGGTDEPDRRIWQLNVSHNNTDLYVNPSDYSRDDNIAIEPRFVQAQDPLHEPLRVRKVKKSGSKVGPGMSFAKTALGETTQKVYLVPAAWGSSGFCNQLGDQMAWNALASDNVALGGTGLLDRAIARLNLTLLDTGGIFRGILWHQGEADSERRACADSYAQNLERMVERIRTEAVEDARGTLARGPQAPVPFIVGTMSKGEDARGDFSRWSETKEQVDGVHRQITDLIPFSDWVNNDDLLPPAYPCGSGSCVHFGSLASREMGRRYYQALERVWERQ